MFRGRYRNNRGGQRGGKSPQSMRLNGLFDKGIWYCSCAPRLPAEHFKVKKEGKNKGRWFYCCQQQQEQRCDFWLWDEDAKPREATAVLNNTRSEQQKDPELQEGWNAGREVHFADSTKQIRSRSSTPSPSPAVYPRLPTTVGQKRSAHQAYGDDEDSDDFFPVSGQEAEALEHAAVASSFETPHKAQKTGVYATPATSGRKSPRKLPWLQQEPVTPMSTKKNVVDYFDTSPTLAKQPPVTTTPAPAPLEIVETPHAPPTLANPQSPSPPSRYKDALFNPADSQSSLTTEVMAELASVKLPAEKLSSLRSILSKHDLRTFGITKGRDISRLALKAKEAKIVELEARISSLRAEKEVDRGVIAAMKWKEQTGLEDSETWDDEL